MGDSNGSPNQREHLGRIDNPYSGKTNGDLKKIADDFCVEKGLPYLKDLFYKAAWIIRNPDNYKRAPGIQGDEIKALKEESTTSFFNQPKQLQINVLTLCVAAIVQDDTLEPDIGERSVACGMKVLIDHKPCGHGRCANLGWPQSFGIRSNWAFGGINAATYFAASLVGCWLSDPLNEVMFYKVFFGRRAAICASAIIILGATIGCAAAQSWQQLLGFRILLGIGMGSKAAVVPVFTGEIAPSQIRGSLVMTWQLFDAFGLFLGFTANLAVSQTGCNAWRWQITCSIIAIIVLLSLIFVCVESPRFLIKHDQYAKAFRTLNLLKAHPVIAARDLLYMHAQLEQAEKWRRPSEPNLEGAESRKIKKRVRRCGPVHYSLSRYLQNLGELFSEPPIRRATLAAVVCMFGQQLCGVNVLAFYSSSFFVKIANKDYGAGLISFSTDENCTPSTAYMQSLWFSWGIVGAVNWIAAIPAYLFIDKYGRRGLLLLALPFMCITMMAAGLGFLADSERARAGIVGTFVFFFMFCYSWSMGPVPFTVSAEVFSLETRVPGMSFAVFTNFFGCGLLALFVPPMSQKLSYGGLLGLFAGFNLMLFFLVFFFVRDTAGITIASVSVSRPIKAAANVDGNQGQQVPQQAGQQEAGEQARQQNSPQAAPQANIMKEVRIARTLTLEELYHVWEPNFRDYRDYQLEEVVPKLWKRYIKRQRDVDPPEPFSTWAEERRDARQTQPSGVQLEQLQAAQSNPESAARVEAWRGSAAAQSGSRTETDGGGGDSILDLYGNRSETGQSGHGASSDGRPAVAPSSSSYRTAREALSEQSGASRLRPTRFSRPSQAGGASGLE